MKTTKLSSALWTAALGGALLGAASSAYAATPAGTRITNQATATYTDSTFTNRTAASNTVVTTVQQVGAVSLAGTGVKNAVSGGQVVYAHSVTNNGNGDDTFALSVANTGGVFTMANTVFYPDANNDGAPDAGAAAITVTPTVAAGATYRFVAVSSLPASLANGSSNILTVTATSAFDTTVKATALDTTTVAGGAGVDITANTTGGVKGAGPGAEASAQDSKNIAAGGTARFTLSLANAAGTADTFNLDASTVANFGTVGLPAGWTVVFKDGNNSVITSATVDANGTKVIYAEVTAPAGATAGTLDVYFRATSPDSGASDRIHNAVVVGAAGFLTLTKAQALDATCDGIPDTPFSSADITSGAVPGACIRYEITARNTGGSDIGAVTVSDNIPANTVYHAVRAAGTTLGDLLAPLAGGVGSVSTTILLMHPNDTAVLTFGVKITP
ncbi:hypothetical protein LQ564_19325 [Massilia sp. G4R7]|uniref:DUF11 domain-containing protein n=1 Tax=Massilia phyllostachyos TaxID=2898585 RepID=A0ABS8Q9P0_9BURK|nr:hypothetical protein [Massilia phyllostachyos]MCD2518457.1 hypothetical protein [Massilia phyllostachyos]